MDNVIRDKVTDVIGLGPGRILRDEWVEQANILVNRG